MAFYDTKPSKYEAVGNGSYMYRWKIQEVSAPESSEQEGEQHTQWQCEEVIVWPPISSNKITEAVVSHIWPSNFEQKLVNEYNAAQLGVYSGEEAQAKIARYTNFLTERAAIKTHIDEDCAELGIE